MVGSPGLHGIESAPLAHPLIGFEIVGFLRVSYCVEREEMGQKAIFKED